MTDTKEQALCQTLASLDSVIVAYSGGVDSAYLAYIAHRTLGDRAVAVTADSPSYPDNHRQIALRVAREFNLRHEMIRTGELERAEQALRQLGFRVCRVRHHDDLARVEIGRDELPRALETETSGRIIDAILALGYREVTIDPRGYRMGSLNEGIVLRPA